MQRQNGRARVLVVDDTDISRELLTESLDAAGHEVEDAASGEVAIKRVREAQGDFDFIIMDQVLLGGMDGIEATRLIHQKYPHVRTIVMTMYGDGQSSRAALDAGAYRYVFRSLDLEEAISDVIALINSSRELSKIEGSLPESFWMDDVCKGMNMALGIVDRTYRVLYANEAQTAVAGGESRVGGICWVEWYQAVQQKEPCPWCPVRPLFEGEDPVVKVVPLVKQGRVRYWQTGASPLLDSRGKVIAALKWGMDVTEREQAHVAALTAQSVDERLEAALDQIRMLGYSRARLYELSEDGQTLVGRRQVGGMNAPITEVRLRVEEDAYSQTTLSSRAPTVHRIGGHGDTLFDDEINRAGVEEWLDLPLWTGDGQLVGKISIDNKVIGPVRPDRPSAPKAITDEHFESLLTIAGFAANAIWNEREYRRAVQESELLRKLRALDADMAQVLEPEAVVQRVVQACLELTGADSGNIRLQMGERLVQMARVGRFSPVLGQELLMSQGYVPCVQVAQTGTSYVANRAQEDQHIVEWKRRITDRSELAILEGLGSYVSYPLEVGGQTIGVLSLQSGAPDFFTDRIRTIIEDFRSRAAVAIQNARLYQRAGRQARQRATLFEVGKAITSSLKLDEVLEEVFRLTGQLIPFENALLFLSDRDTGELSVRESYGYEQRFVEEQGFTFRPGEGYTGWIAETQRPLLIEDAELCSDIQPKYRFIGRDRPLKSFIGVPLIARGQLIGVFEVTSDRPRAFNQEHLDLLAALADQLAIAIEQARLFGETESLLGQLTRRAQQLSGIAEVATRIQSTDDPEIMLHLALTGVTARQGLGFSRAMLFLVNDDRDRLEGKVAIGAMTHEEALKSWRDTERYSLQDYLDAAAKWPPQSSKPLNRTVLGMSIPLADAAGALARCIEEKRAIHVPDAHNDPLTNGQLVDNLHTDAFVAVPLMARGRAIGVLVVDNKFLPHSIMREDLDIVEAFASQVAIAIENARLAQQRDDTFSDIAHQLYSPLTSMKVPTDMLADGEVKDPETAQEYYRIIAKAAEEFTRMVTDILNLRRIEAGAFDLWRRKVSVTDVVQKVVHLFRFSAAAKDIEIETVFDHGVDTIRADEDKITAALQALLENAIQFSEEGSRVSISTFNDQETIAISVRDEGYGIPEDELPHIFEKRFRGRITAEKAIEGMGIGLTIARHVVEQHGGAISVESTPGEGSTFIIRLPIQHREGRVK